MPWIVGGRGSSAEVVVKQRVDVDGAGSCRPRDLHEHDARVLAPASGRERHRCEVVLVDGEAVGDAIYVQNAGTCHVLDDARRDGREPDPGAIDANSRVGIVSEIACFRLVGPRKAVGVLEELGDAARRSVEGDRADAVGRGERVHAAVGHDCAGDGGRRQREQGEGCREGATKGATTKAERAAHNEPTGYQKGIVSQRVKRTDRR